MAQVPCVGEGCWMCLMQAEIEGLTFTMTFARDDSPPLSMNNTGTMCSLRQRAERHHRSPPDSTHPA